MLKLIVYLLSAPLGGTLCLNQLGNNTSNPGAGLKSKKYVKNRLCTFRQSASAEMCCNKIQKVTSNGARTLFSHYNFSTPVLLTKSHISKNGVWCLFVIGHYSGKISNPKKISIPPKTDLGNEIKGVTEPNIIEIKIYG